MSILPLDSKRLRPEFLQKFVGLRSASWLREFREAVERKTKMRWTESAIAGLSLFYQVVALHSLDLATDIALAQTLQTSPIPELAFETPVSCSVSIRNSFDQRALWPKTKEERDAARRQQEEDERKEEEAARQERERRRQHEKKVRGKGNGKGKDKEKDKEKIETFLTEEEELEEERKNQQALREIREEKRKPRKGQTVSASIFGLIRHIDVDRLVDAMHTQQQTGANEAMMQQLPLILKDKNKNPAAVFSNWPAFLEETGDVYQCFPSPGILYESEELEQVTSPPEMRPRMLWIYEKARKEWTDTQFEAAATVWFTKYTSKDKDQDKDKDKSKASLKVPEAHKPVLELMERITVVTGSVPWFSAQTASGLSGITEAWQAYTTKRQQLLGPMLLQRVASFLIPQKETEFSSGEREKKSWQQVVGDLGLMVKALSTLHQYRFDVDKILGSLLSQAELKSLKQFLPK